MGSSPSRELLRGARSGDLNGVLSALNAGADINYRSDDGTGKTALIISSKYGHLPVVELLLARMALDFQDSKGNTAMHEAARMGRVEVVNALLDRGSNPFCKNYAGMRAIDVAAVHGRVETLRLMEAKVAPFFCDLELETRGFLGLKSSSTKWVVIHRARPRDDRSVNRYQYKICMYANQKVCLPEYEFTSATIKRAPEIVTRGNTPLNTILRWHLHCESSTNSSSTSKEFVVTSNADNFEWFRRVLDDSFTLGRGPAFDNFGNVILPLSGQRTLQALVSKYGKDSNRRSYAASTPAEMPSGPASAPTVYSSVTNPVPPMPSMTSVMPVDMGNQSASMVMPRGVYAGAVGPNGYIIPPQMVAMPQMMPSAPAPVPTAVPTTQGYPSYLSADVLKLIERMNNDELHFDVDEPKQYLCSITMELMIDPVIATDGNCYSRAGIEAWFREGKRTSPITNKVLDGFNVIPNNVLRSEILSWIEQHDTESAAVRSRIAAEQAAAASVEIVPVPVETEEINIENLPKTNAFSSSFVAPSGILSDDSNDLHFYAPSAAGHNPRPAYVEPEATPPSKS